MYKVNNNINMDDKNHFVGMRNPIFFKVLNVTVDIYSQSIEIFTEYRYDKVP